MRSRLGSGRSWHVNLWSSGWPGRRRRRWPDSGSSAIDVLLGLGAAASHVDQWRRGPRRSLEQVAGQPQQDHRRDGALRHGPRQSQPVGDRLRRSGPPSAAVQRHRRGRHRARVSLLDDTRSQACGRATKPAPRLVMPVNDWSCASCGGSGDLMFLEDAGPLCLDCADYGHLVFLPSRDAALTRQAKRAAGFRRCGAVSRARKRPRASGHPWSRRRRWSAPKTKCLADAEVRARRRGATGATGQRGPASASRIRRRGARCSRAARPAGPKTIARH